MRLFAVAVLAASLIAGAARAEDRLLDLRQPSVVAAALREGGYKAEIKANTAGEPYILSSANGADFTVEFYGCTGVKDCASYQFTSWYKPNPLFTAAFANQWNQAKRFLKISVDSDGNLNEFMDFTAVGKTTFTNFIDSVAWYEAMDAALGKYIAEKQAARGK